MAIIKSFICLATALLMIAAGPVWGTERPATYLAPAGPVLGFYHDQIGLDPVAAWNTFQGSSQYDSANDIAVDGNGHVYLTGTSQFAWGGFQTINQFPGTLNKNTFVAKFDGTTGALIWNTFLGSGGTSEDDHGSGIVLDENGYIYITGFSYHTWGTNPTRGFSGNTDAFVAKLSAETGVLIKHTFLGSTNGQDFGRKIGSKNGKIFVVGTGDGSWQNAPEPKQNYGGLNDAFVARLDAGDLSLDWYTFLGSYGAGDEGEDLAVAPSGNTYVIGTSLDSWGGVKVVRPHSPGTGIHDAFVAMLDAAGGLVWNTFLGSGSHYYGKGIVVDGNEQFCYATGDGHGGWTEDPVHPYSFNGDVFVAKLAALGGDLQWHTFLGSGDTENGYDYGKDLALGGNGGILITGYSLATWGDPIRPFTPGTIEAFAAKLKDSGERIWNTFLGGSGNDYGQSIAVDAGNALYVAGRSDSGWPWGNTQPVEPYHGQGEDDGFIVKLAYRTISGKVTIGGFPQSGVTVTITGGTAAVTDGNGNYQFVVEDGWDGTIIPNLGNYVFSPPDKTYQDIFRDEVQDFSAAIIMLAIEGVIIDDELGTPASGVEVRASNGIATVTDNEGKYRIYQPTNWSGTITPTKAGYENDLTPGFTPPNRTYTNLQIDTYSEHYSATWKVYVSGQINTRAGVPFNKVVVLDGMPRHPITNQPQNTDASGAYRARVRYGWNGTVTPVYDHTLFTTDNPHTAGGSSRTYASVTGPLTNQNYWGDPAYYLTGQVMEGTQGIAEVTLTASNNGGSAVTGTNGNYTLTLLAGWNGTVTPSKPGYSFSPASQTYSSLSQDEVRNFSAEWLVNISGYITKQSTGGPIEHVILNGLPGNPETDAAGFYTAKVSNNWSGKVTPTLSGYLFGPPPTLPGFTFGPPASTVYDNLHEPAPAQNYTAFEAVSISGSIRENGIAVPERLSLSVATEGRFFTAETVNGSYSFNVKKGSIPVTLTVPDQAGYRFEPENRYYSSVAENLVSQDFAAFWKAYLSGIVTKSGGGGLAGVLLKGLPGTPRTDQSGSYRARVSYEWSGTVTPSLLGYRFEPESWGYSLVDTELTGNYTAYSVPIHTISGQVRAKGAPLSGITLNASSGEATATDGNGNFLLAFNEGWSGSVTPTANGYTFSPPSRTYSSLLADLVSQDFLTGSYLYLPLILK